MLLSRYRTIVMASVVAIGLQSCTQVDDYMLGKDNAPAPTPLKPINATLTLLEKWSVYTGNPGQSNDDLKLTPVIHHGVVYTASIDGTVQATDKKKGTLLWTKHLPQHLLSGPTIDDRYIAVATTSSTVIVLNQKDGSMRWQANLSGDSLAKPVMTDKEVLVKTIDGNLYAFDLKTSDKRWVVDHGSPHLILKASSSPVLMGGLALVGFSDGKLDAVDTLTGRVMWQRNIAYASGGSDVERLVDIDADPIVRGDHVYLASYQGYIGALSLKNGEFTWRKPASIYKNMWMSGDTLYYVDSEGIVWARNRITGHVKWKQEALKARGLTEPVIMHNRIFVGDSTGLLHGLDSQTGQFISRTELHSPILTAPVVSDSSIYILTANGKLSRYSTHS